MQRYALALVVASLFALPTQGAVTLVASYGEVDITGQVGLDPLLPQTALTSFSHEVPRPDSGLFQQSLYDVRSSPQYGTISSMTSQVSYFTLAPDSQLSGASFAGTSAVTAATFSPYVSATTAYNMFSFLFQVTGTPVDYNLAISFAPLGPPSDSTFELWDTSLSIPLVSISSESTPGNGIAAAGTLQPGLYRVNSWTGYAVYALASANVAYASSMDYTFALTPEPASLALLALGGLAILRRRR